MAGRFIPPFYKAYVYKSSGFSLYKDFSDITERSLMAGRFIWVEERPGSIPGFPTQEYKRLRLCINIFI